MRERAADALRITAPDLRRLGVIDDILPEPAGGAHADPEAAARTLHDALVEALETLKEIKPEKLLRRRREKFLAMGQVVESDA